MNMTYLCKFNMSLLFSSNFPSVMAATGTSQMHRAALKLQTTALTLPLFPSLAASVLRFSIVSVAEPWL